MRATEMAGAALVTGGASGIGRATAYALAGRGYQVAVDHLGREAEAKQVAADIGGVAYEADVSDVAAVDELVAAVESDLGPIEVAVACAGFDVDVPADFFSGLPKAGDAISAPAARQVIKTNPFVFMILSSLFIPISQSAAPSIRGPQRERPADFDLRTRAPYF